MRVPQRTRDAEDLHFSFLINAEEAVFELEVRVPGDEAQAREVPSFFAPKDVQHSVVHHGQAALDLFHDHGRDNADYVPCAQLGAKPIWEVRNAPIHARERPRELWSQDIAWLGFVCVETQFATSACGALHKHVVQFLVARQHRV